MVPSSSESDQHARSGQCGDDVGSSVVVDVTECRGHVRRYTTHGLDVVVQLAGGAIKNLYAAQKNVALVERDQNHVGRIAEVHLLVVVVVRQVGDQRCDGAVGPRRAIDTAIRPLNLGIEAVRFSTIGARCGGVEIVADFANHGLHDVGSLAKVKQDSVVAAGVVGAAARPVPCRGWRTGASAAGSGGRWRRIAALAALGSGCAVRHRLGRARCHGSQNEGQGAYAPRPVAHKQDYFLGHPMVVPRSLPHG